MLYTYLTLGLSNMKPLSIVISNSLSLSAPVIMQTTLYTNLLVRATIIIISMGAPYQFNYTQ